MDRDVRLIYQYLFCLFIYVYCTVYLFLLVYLSYTMYDILKWLMWSLNPDFELLIK